MASVLPARRLGVANPRTGANDYAIVPLNGAGVGACATRLRAAQPGWAARSPADRAGTLRAFGDALAEERAALFAALAADTGRHALGRLEIAGVTAMIGKWARLGPELLAREGDGFRASLTPGVSVARRLHPYPLVGAIVPWNYPLTLALIDALPALAAGCAVIVKPSEVTPRFAEPLRRAVAAVPALDAVFAVVDGDGATGAALVEAVDYVCFTGSVATGRKVAMAAAARLIPASLELGGKDPLIVLPSADPVAAATIALRSAVVGTGQACQSIERVLVPAGPFGDAFVRALVTAAGAVRLNWPDIETGDIGPFIHAPQAAIVQAQIDEAVAAGACVLTGGRVETLGGGRYLRPTVLTDVTPAMAVWREETFGPVLPVMRYGSLDEAVTLANESDFGLSAAVLAGAAGEAAAVGARLRAGAVSLGDAALTTMVSDAEKTSFGVSGVGPSRMGDSGLLRFLRWQALLRQDGVALPLAAYAEDAA